MSVPASFRQSDVTRLIRGAIKAGYQEAAIRLTLAPDGSLSLAIQRPADNDDTERDSSWDDA